MKYFNNAHISSLKHYFSELYRKEQAIHFQLPNYRGRWRSLVLYKYSQRARFPLYRARNLTRLWTGPSLSNSPHERQRGVVET